MAANKILKEIVQGHIVEFKNKIEIENTHFHLSRSDTYN
jgi:propanediol utilization protein